MSYFRLTALPAFTVRIGAALAGLVLFSCAFSAAVKGAALARYEKQDENT
jgi:hypothetical protein